MNHSDIEHMAQGSPPSSIGKDHEEVVTFLATSLLAAQQKLDAVKALADIAGEMNGVVKDGFAEVVAQRDALAAENAALNEMYRHAVKELDDTCFEIGMMRGEKAMEYAVPETPATDAYLNSVRSDVIPENLKFIGELIRTQDNRITDQPMFVVFEKREIIGSDEHSPSRIVWVWEGEEVDELRGKRLELLYQDGRDTRGYDRYAMQEIDVFVTACFTEQGCKDYLQRNGHNLRQPFIYAAGSFRNHEYQTVRNWLMTLPPADSTT